MAKVLRIIVCAAGPAPLFRQLVSLARQHGWDVRTSLTPRAARYFGISDNDIVNEQTAHTHPDAIIIAPATFNTINRLARRRLMLNGPIDVLTQIETASIPTAILPFVNTSLASRRPFQESVHALYDRGIAVLLGRHGFEPHAAGSGSGKLNSFPWMTSLDAIDAIQASGRVYGGRPVVPGRPARIAASEATKMLYLFVFDGRNEISTHTLSALIAHAHVRGWRVRVISSPQAVQHFDRSDIEYQTGVPVQTDHQGSSRPRGSLPKADAILVVGATATIIHNLAAGFSDSYAMDVLNETLHLVPIAILADVHRGEATSSALQESIYGLSQEGASVMLASEATDIALWTNTLDRLVAS